MFIEELLEIVVDRKASDLHLSVGVPPAIRIDGELLRLEVPPFSAEDVEKIIFSMLTNEQRRNLEQNWELDCSYGLHGLGRFRVNVYKERGNYAAALRSITSEIPSIESLGLPEIVTQIAGRPRGLILVTGPTGSGKSTTLAAMIDHVNSSRPEHIL
ncbi:MAG: ATPase, T2SS/T4P/T4SS family, partial [Candidatus Gastranaerophilaceae bacterium]